MQGIIDYNQYKEALDSRMHTDFRSTSYVGKMKLNKKLLARKIEEIKLEF